MTSQSGTKRGYSETNEKAESGIEKLFNMYNENSSKINSFVVERSIKTDADIELLNALGNLN